MFYATMICWELFVVWTLYLSGATPLLCIRVYMCIHLLFPLKYSWRMTCSSVHSESICFCGAIKFFPFICGELFTPFFVFMKDHAQQCYISLVIYFSVHPISLYLCVLDLHAGVGCIETWILGLAERSF